MVLSSSVESLKSRLQGTNPYMAGYGGSFNRFLSQTLTARFPTLLALGTRIQRISENNN